MDEELMDIITEENIEVEAAEVVETEVVIQDEEYDISTKEIIETVEVASAEEIVVEMDEAMGWVGGDSERHYSLLGRNDPNQHDIKAITGLRAELDEIKKLKTVYSDRPNIANYYKWKDAAYDDYGYFVSIVPGKSVIKICEGPDVFGVSVDAAGFIGEQDAKVPRDSTYGLIVTSGLVDVRCELDVEVGDYVISNAYGYATKSHSNYGYKVFAKENKNGVEYAVIALGVQADVTNMLGEKLVDIDKRVGVNETNIISAINVANQAYNKASNVVISNKEMSDKVENVLGVVDKVTTDVENMGSQVSNSALISAQAKAIAEGAATSAMSMRNEAVEKANEALADTSKLRKEFNSLTIDLDTKLDSSSLELQEVKESIESTRDDLQDNIDNAVKDLEELEKDLEPLATWSAGSENLTGVAGFVARADEDSATLASIVIWKGDAGDSLAGFVQEATEENAEIKALAGYTYTDKNGVEHTSVAALDAYAKDNEAGIEAIVGVNGSLAGLQAQVNENTASVTTLATWSNNVSIGGRNLLTNTDFNGDSKRYEILPGGSSEGGFRFTPTVQIDSGADYVLSAKIRGTSDIVFYEINDGGNVSHLWVTKDNLSETEYRTFSITFNVDVDKTFRQVYICTKWGISAEGEWFEIAPMSLQLEKGNQVTDWSPAPEDTAQSIAGVKSIADANKSQLDAMASYDTSDGAKSAIVGMTAYVDANSANFSTLAQYRNDDSGNSGISGLVADVDDNTSTLSAIVNHEFTKNDGTVVTGLAGLNAYVNENESNVSLVANRVAGKYTVIDSWSVSGKNPSTVYYAKDTKLYWYYNNDWKSTSDAYVAGLPASMSGIQAVADDHSSKIDSLTIFENHTERNLARIEQKADANGAYIQSTVSNMDKYAVGPYSQAYGFTLEQATSVLEEGMIYVPTIDKIENDAETYNYTDPNGDFQTYKRSFLRGYLYQWGKRPNGLYGWITVDKDYDSDITEENADPTNAINTSAMAVYFSAQEIEISNGNNYGYWYTNGDTITNIDGTTGTYTPYTLYKWDLPYKYNNGTTDVKEYHWVAVATLAGNSQNRAVSQIRQNTNSIIAEVTDVKGDVAKIEEDIDENKAEVSLLTAWRRGDTPDEYSESIIKQTSDDNMASITISAYQRAEDGTAEKETSLVLTSNDDGGALCLSADNINFTARDYSVVAENITLKADQLDFGGDETEEIKIEAKHIDFTGDATFVRPEDIGDGGSTTISGNRITTGKIDAERIEVDDLTAFGATIGGWSITDDKIYQDSTWLISNEDIVYNSAISDESSPIRLMTGANQQAKDITIEVRCEDGSLELTTYSEDNWCLIDVQVDGVHCHGDSDEYEINMSYNANVITLSGKNVAGPANEVVKVIVSCLYIDVSQASFKVLNDGSLYANSANISGVITAEDGDIGGWKIYNGYLENTSKFFVLCGETTEQRPSISNNTERIDVLSYAGNEIYQSTFDDVQTSQYEMVTRIDNENNKGSVTVPIEISQSPSDDTLFEIELSESITLTRVWSHTDNAFKIGPWTQSDSGANVWFADVSGSYQLIDDPSLVNGTIEVSGSVRLDTDTEITVTYNEEDNGVVRYNGQISTYLKNPSLATLSLKAKCKYEVSLDDWKIKDEDIDSLRTEKQGSATIYWSAKNEREREAILGKQSVDTYWGKINYTVKNTGNAQYVLLADGSMYVHDLSVSGVTDFAVPSSTDSDRNKKNSIQELDDIYLKLLDKTQTVSYKYNADPSYLTHLGVVAQDVEKVMREVGIDSDNCALLHKRKNADGEYEYGIRYEEFIAILIKKTQEQQKQIDDQAASIARLEEKIIELGKLITTQND